MVRRFFLALAVLGAFFIIAAGAAQAGWGGHSYESTQPGESMSSETATPEETWSSSELSGESMESSGYESEVAVETGRLPEEERFESGVILGDDIERKLREGFVAGGP